jgi:hypothetical protein
MTKKRRVSASSREAEAMLIPDNDQDFLRSDPLALFTADEIEAEIDALLEAVRPGTPTPTSQDMDELDMMPESERKDCITFLLGRGGLHGPVHPDHPPQLAPHERWAVTLQLLRVRIALHHGLRHTGTDFWRTRTLLLPVSWERRMTLLLLDGRVPLVWLRSWHAGQYEHQARAALREPGSG